MSQGKVSKKRMRLARALAASLGYTGGRLESFAQGILHARKNGDQNYGIRAKEAADRRAYEDYMNTVRQGVGRGKK